MDTRNQQEENDNKMKSKSMKKALLALNCIILGIGASGGPLLQRLYFIKGGKRIWIVCCLQTAGWPLLLLPLLAYRKRNGRQEEETKLLSLKPYLFLPCAVLGVLTGLDNYLASSGVSCLPVSTVLLILATQLAFTAGFAFLLVKQTFSAFTINSIFLISLGAVVLALRSSNDRPDHESSKMYYEGFFMILGASALYGFVLAATELTFKKAKEPITYSLVMEMQIVISVSATVFGMIGMLVNHDFQAIPGEARNFELGEVGYYMVLGLNAIIWQFFFLGVIGVVFCSSSLLSGIILSVMLPVTEILAVVFFHDKFQAEKGVSLTLSLWGFISYFYGEFQQSKKMKIDQERLPPTTLADCMSESTSFHV